jgi:hypothetical protein
MEGALAAKQWGVKERPDVVIVLDDLWTTGSSLRAAMSALEHEVQTWAKPALVWGLCLSETPLKRKLSASTKRGLPCGRMSLQAALNG